MDRHPTPPSTAPRSRVPRLPREIAAADYSVFRERLSQVLSRRVSREEREAYLRHLDALALAQATALGRLATPEGEAREVFARTVQALAVWSDATRRHDQEPPSSVLAELVVSSAETDAVRELVVDTRRNG